jgi:NADH-quinone oxidoreductase subunit C
LADSGTTDTAEATDDGDVTDDAPALSPAQQAALAKLEAELGDEFVGSAAAHGDLVVRVKRDAWLRTAQFAKAELECDYLSFVAGIDWMPAPVLTEEGSGDTSSPVQPRETTYGLTGSDGRFQLFAHVESTHRHFGVTVKTDLDESEPVIESWVTVYPGADWHERECWEMFGFQFSGHPSLRHIYLPSEFEGHPLRKDFPLLAREVKPWPGLVDVEPMPGDDSPAEEEGGASE